MMEVLHAKGYPFTQNALLYKVPLSLPLPHFSTLFLPLSSSVSLQGQRRL